MKSKGIAVALLLGILLVAGAACGGSGGVSPTPTPTIPAGVTKPDIGYVPQGWHISEYPPGELSGCLFNADCAYIGCHANTDICLVCLVDISYGQVPVSKQDMYNDVDSLLELANERGFLNISNWQTTTVSDQTAVYEYTCDNERDSCFWHAICINASAFYEVIASWMPSCVSETEIMQIIDSITF